MKKYLRLFLITFIFFYGNVRGEDFLSLSKDIETIERVDAREKSLPFLLNYNLQAGYLTMPSARTTHEGFLALGSSYLPPYTLFGAFMQFSEYLSFWGNYWIFNGLEEKNLSPYGFGDDADRTAGVQFNLPIPMDHFPTIGVGLQDCIGSKRFFSFYTVLTWQMKKKSIDLSLGWGKGRIDGFFGGLAYFPLYDTTKWVKELALLLEYDGNNYSHHPYEHPKGRSVNFPLNFGFSIPLGPYVTWKASSLRGKCLATGLNVHYDFGKKGGFFPKNDLCYPDREELIKKVTTNSSSSLSSSFDREEEGFLLQKAFLEVGLYTESIEERSEEKGESILTLVMVNTRYREEMQVRKRLAYILSHFLPSHIEKVIITMRSMGIDLHRYTYFQKYLEKFQKKEISLLELEMVSKKEEETSCFCPQNACKEKNENPKEKVDEEKRKKLLFKREKPIYTATIRPRLLTYFGSSKGKFKYDAGFLSSLEGSFFRNWYYDIEASFSLYATSGDVGDRDLYNPSKLLNVRTDMIQYYKKSRIRLEKAYVQKGWNLGNGVFTRFSIGYFEIAYGGLAFEALYFPIKGDVSIGIETALLGKRDYSGLGIFSKVRKLEGDVYLWKRYLGWQYFLDLYYRYTPWNMDFKISLGRFLAKDKGASLTLTKYFASGLRLNFWYTITDGKDMVNYHRYYDKGIGFSIPLDFFMPRRSKERVGYGIAFWLRDVGAKAKTGKELYPIIYEERKYLD